MADDSRDTPLTRRRMLGGVAGLAGVAALAGCTASEEQQQYAGTAEAAATEQPPTRPVNPGQEQYAQFVLDSLAYQNAQAQAQTQALAALLEDAGLIVSGGDE